MTQIFGDGFESGDFSAWTSTAGTTAITDSVVHHGSHAMEVALTTSGYGYAHKDLAAGENVLFMRQYVRFNNLPNAGSEYQFGGAIFGGLAGALQWCRIRNNAGTIQWGMTFHAAGVISTVWSAQKTNPSTNTWYCIETEADLSTNDGNLDGSYRMYVDGSELSDIAQTNVDTDDTTVIRVWGGYLEHNIPSHAVTFDFDCVVVSDAYIGPESTVTLQTVADALTLDTAVFRDKLLSVVDLAGLQDSQSRGKLLLILERVGVDDLPRTLKALTVNDTQTLADTVLTPTRIVRLAEGVTLAELAFVGEVGATKTKLFLILGEFALQLTGE